MENQDLLTYLGGLAVTLLAGWIGLIHMKTQRNADAIREHENKCGKRYEESAIASGNVHTSLATITVTLANVTDTLKDNGVTLRSIDDRVAVISGRVGILESQEASRVSKR